MIQSTRWPFTSEEVRRLSQVMSNFSNFTSYLIGFLGLIVAPFLSIDGLFYDSKAQDMLIFNFVGAIVLIAYYGVVSALLFFLFSR